MTTSCRSTKRRSEKCGQIFDNQFPDAPPSDIEHLADRLRNPFKKRFRTILSVAENSRHRRDRLCDRVARTGDRLLLSRLSGRWQGCPGTRNRCGAVRVCPRRSASRCAPRVSSLSVCPTMKIVAPIRRFASSTRPDCDSTNNTALGRLSVRPMKRRARTAIPTTCRIWSGTIWIPASRLRADRWPARWPRRSWNGSTAISVRRNMSAMVVASFRDDPVKIREPRYVKTPVDRKTGHAARTGADRHHDQRQTRHSPHPRTRLRRIAGADQGDLGRTRQERHGRDDRGQRVSDEAHSGRA